MRIVHLKKQPVGALPHAPYCGLSVDALLLQQQDSEVAVARPASFIFNRGRFIYLNVTSKRPGATKAW
jgi:hypothetical protein